MLVLIRLLTFCIFPFGAVILLAAIIDARLATLANPRKPIYKSPFFYMWLLQAVMFTLVTTFV